MQVTETLAEGLKREFRVVVPAAELDTKVTDRLKDVARTATLPGFRPGKVPVALLRKRYGKAVMGEVLEEAVNETSRRAIEERDLRPVMRPRIEIVSFDEGGDLEYTIALELFPDITPMDFSTLALERMVVEIDEAEVERALERLADAHKESRPIDDAAHEIADGDLAVLDFVGKLNGEEFPGSRAEDYSLEIGSDTFVAGFEAQLVGAKAGDAREVRVTFPDDYAAENLRGQEVVFEVEVKEIRTSAPAAIDDALAKKAGKETLDDLRQAVRDEYGREYAGLSRLRLKRSLLDALADGHDFEVPPGMLETEARSVAVALGEEDKTPDGETDEPEDDGDESETPPPEVTDEHRDLAERRVRLGLLLADVGRRNNIEVTAEEVGRALSQEAAKYPGHENVVIEYYRKNEELLENIKAPLFEDKVCDFILELAQVTDRPVGVKELLAEEDDEDSADQPAGT